MDIAVNYMANRRLSVGANYRAHRYVKTEHKKVNVVITGDTNIT